MSLHKSLKSDKYNAKRNVRKRYERLQALLEKGKEILTVFALPKEKIVRLKLKKPKEEKAEKDLITYVKEAEKKAKKKSKDVGKIK